jgi:hypothetical protein
MASYLILAFFACGSRSIIHQLQSLEALTYLGFPYSLASEILYSIASRGQRYNAPIPRPVLPYLDPLRDFTAVEDKRLATYLYRERCGSAALQVALYTPYYSSQSLRSSVYRLNTTMQWQNLPSA